MTTVIPNVVSLAHSFKCPTHKNNAAPKKASAPTAAIKLFDSYKADCKIVVERQRLTNATFTAKSGEEQILSDPRTSLGIILKTSDGFRLYANNNASTRRTIGNKAAEIKFRALLKDSRFALTTNHLSSAL
jgi:hypothetical protein